MNMVDEKRKLPQREINNRSCVHVKDSDSKRVKGTRGARISKNSVRIPAITRTL